MIASTRISQVLELHIALARCMADPARLISSVCSTVLAACFACLETQPREEDIQGVPPPCPTCRHWTLGAQANVPPTTRRSRFRFFQQLRYATKDDGEQVTTPCIASCLARSRIRSDKISTTPPSTLIGLKTPLWPTDFEIRFPASLRRVSVP
jgi:hypothetical protein